MNPPPIQPLAHSPRLSAAAWFLLVALLFEILLTSPLLLHDFGPSELNRFVLFAILQFPYILSLIALVFVQGPLSQNMALGVAMAVSGCAALAETVLALGATLLWSWTVKDDPKAYIWLLVLLVLNLLIFFVSLFSSKSRRGVYASAFFATVGYCFLIPWTMQSAWNVQRVNSEQARMKAFATARDFRTLIACLNQNRFHNPASGYPTSLESIAAVPTCNPGFAREDTFPGYELRYIPRRPSGSAEVTGFELVAMPRGPKRPGLEPILGNDSGMIVEVNGWSTSALQPNFTMLVVAPVDFSSVIAAAKDFAKQDPHRQPPRSLDELVEFRHVFPDHGPTGTLGNKFQSGVFTLEYFPPTSASPDEFSVAATCTSYGTECLRSFLVESSGNIHSTAEPRSATRADPMVSVDTACLMQAHCPGLTWPVP